MVQRHEMLESCWHLKREPSRDAKGGGSCDIARRFATASAEGIIANVGGNDDQEEKLQQTQPTIADYDNLWRLVRKEIVAILPANHEFGVEVQHNHPAITRKRSDKGIRSDTGFR